MARDCTNSSTSNYLNLAINAIGSLLNGSSAISLAAWGNQDTFNAGGANTHRIVSEANSSATQILFGYDGSATPKVARVGGRSVAGEGFEAVNGTTTISTGTWQHIGGVLDYAGDKIRVYTDGNQDSNTTVTFDNSSYTNSSHATVTPGIGNDGGTPPATTNNMIDGRVAEIAIWNIDIGTSAFVQLAKGFSPLLVRPESLVFYLPLIGKFSPEIELISGKNCTVNGTVNAASHPRIYYPTGGL